MFLGQIFWVHTASDPTQRKVQIMATEAPAKGISWLAEQVEAKTGQAVDGAKLRVILRKLVADETIERGDGRWSFTGLKDPAVAAVIAAVKEEAKAEPAAKKAPAKKAAPAAGAKPASAKSRRRKPAPEPEPEDDEALVDDDELDLD